MRLHPTVSEEEAYEALRAQAVNMYGEEDAKTLEASLRALSEAMSAISASPLPITVAP